MSTCGYLCPSCEGKGYTTEGEDCTWCKPSAPKDGVDHKTSEEKKSEKEVSEWIKQVHEGPCCSHPVD